MAQLRIEFNTTSLEEGAGTFTATFTLIEEPPNDPPTPDHSFTWFITDNTAFAPDDFTTDGFGNVSFTAYGAAGAQVVDVATPVADMENESFEDFFVSVANLSGTNGLTLEAGSSVETTLTIECFLKGTNILTEAGYRAVEDLKIGDKVKTFDGKIETIKWIGKQTHHRFFAHPLRSLPIQIKAGALGSNMPRRDLFVSPDHAILVDGVLINAGALVNDISILKTYPDLYIYYHIELENHAILDAEGAPAESYLPNQEDRSNYDNGAEYEELYPEGSNLMLWPMDYPRVSSKNKVPRYISKKLLAIASELESKALVKV